MIGKITLNVLVIDQEAKIMVVPCPSVQPIEEALDDCTCSVIPIIFYAINQDTLSTEQVAELWKVKEMLSFPICFIRIPATLPEASPEPGRRAEKEREKSTLYKQLLSLGFLSNPVGNCSCGAPAQTPGPTAKPQSMLVEAFERLHRLLVPFARQVLQNQQVEAASLLNGVHCRCLDLFINQVGVCGREERWCLLLLSCLSVFSLHPHGTMIMHVGVHNTIASLLVPIVSTKL